MPNITIVLYDFLFSKIALSENDHDFRRDAYDCKWTVVSGHTKRDWFDESIQKSKLTGVRQSPFVLLVQ